ncbi:MAG: CPBP family intramembrane glutamic endopeptidase [Planctomycetota bacterium]
MAKRSHASTRSARRNEITSYWERTQWPLQSLYFLLPLIIGYEIGAVLLAGDGTERLPAIYAERLLGRFFELFGVGGVYLPGVLAVGLLLTLHVMRGDPWKPEPKLYLGMTVESLLWALPLFVLGTLVSGTPQVAWMLSTLSQQTIDHLPIPFAQGVVFSIGAGIYEELMFRVIAIALIHVLLDDLLALPKHIGQWGAIVGSALLFAAYHFVGTEQFDAARFVFYALAGLYFAIIYVGRGFGVVAATHALYDVLAVWSQST